VLALDSRYTHEYVLLRAVYIHMCGADRGRRWVGFGFGFGFGFGAWARRAKGDGLKREGRRAKGDGRWAEAGSG